MFLIINQELLTITSNKTITIVHKISEKLGVQITQEVLRRVPFNDYWFDFNHILHT